MLACWRAQQTQPRGQRTAGHNNPACRQVKEKKAHHPLTLRRNAATKNPKAVMARDTISSSRKERPKALPVNCRGGWVDGGKLGVTFHCIALHVHMLINVVAFQTRAQAPAGPGTGTHGRQLAHHSEAESVAKADQQAGLHRRQHPLEQHPAGPEGQRPQAHRGHCLPHSAFLLLHHIVHQEHKLQMWCLKVASSVHSQVVRRQRQGR